ncbi:WD40 repeat domain-containing protein [Pseudanabaena cinerea]
MLSGHNKPVMSISFSPNRKLLASGSRDKTVRIWQLS